MQSAITAWTKKQQQEYLKARKLPIHGIKADLVNRIMMKVSIDDAVKITKEYKTKKRKEMIMVERNKDNENQPAHAKEIKDMETILKRKREAKEGQTTKK